jgi:hypothetical protein
MAAIHLSFDGRDESWNCCSRVLGFQCKRSGREWRSPRDSGESAECSGVGVLIKVARFMPCGVGSWLLGEVAAGFVLRCEGDARRQVVCGVPRCLQPLQGWLTFGWGPVPVTARGLPPAFVCQPSELNRNTGIRVTRAAPRRHPITGISRTDLRGRGVLVGLCKGSVHAKTQRRQERESMCLQA